MDTSTPDSWKANRRQLLLATVGGAAGSLLPSFARAAEAYPSQPIHIIVPFGPGGLGDISTRLVAQKLSAKLGVQVLAENRPGAGGVVAANAALNAAHDGYTLIMFSNGTAISPSLFKLPYKPQEDFVPVSSMAYFDLVLLTAKDGKLKDLKDVLAEGKKRQLTLGTINPGSTQNLSAELFKSTAHLNATIVPFKTSSEVQLALQRGDIDMGIESYAALRAGIDSGVLRPIAVTGSHRAPWLPEVPTVKEAGLPGYEVTGWNAIYAPKGTPQAAIDKLNAALRESLAEPDLRKRLLSMGVDPQGSSPAEMAELFEHDRKKWADVIDKAHIKLKG